MTLTPLRIPRNLKKKLEKKPPEMQAAIVACLRQLQEDWRHPSLQSSKLGGTDGIYHAKVSRGNRITFFWEGDRIVIENHCHHDILKGYK
ncbi:MAG: hypothetical protein ACYCUM_04615 [Solirubrobacteraceae bacterium]